LLPPTEEEKLLKKRFREKSDIIGLSVLSFTILGIVIPNLMLSGNLDEIPKAVLYYRYFFGSTFGIFCISSLVLMLLPRRITLITVSLLGSYAILIFIFDILYPLQVGPMVRGTESGKFAPIAGMWQLAFIVTLFFLLYVLPRQARYSLSWFLAGLLIIMNLPLLFAKQDSAFRADSIAVSESQANTPDFNIYHLVFDSYYSPWLEWALTELEKTPLDLAGFTHYRRCVSSYWLTETSYPSFMSGTVYRAGEDYQKWWEGTNQNSMIEDLHARGFTTNFYGLQLKNGMKAVQKRYIEDPGGTGIASWPLVLDLWFLRISPVFFRHTILKNGVGPTTRIVKRILGQPQGNIITLVSYRQFKKFISDEKHRASEGNYIHGYFVPPHPTYQLDRDGNYTENSSYPEQMLLATNMIFEFINTLKQLGRFDKSMIIIHADHGDVTSSIIDDYKHTTHFPGDPLRDCLNIQKNSSKMLLKTYLQYNKIDMSLEELAAQKTKVLPAAKRWFGFGIHSGAALEVRLQPLLLIKPPGTDPEPKDLVIKNSLVQLLDLRKYVSSAIDNKTYSYPERKSILINVPLYLELKTFTSHIGQFRVYPDGNWKLNSVLKVQAEYM